MCDSNAHTPSPEAPASAETNTIVQRQSPRPPMTVPIGVPRAVDAVKPVITTARAKPRFSGETIVAAAPVAVGANIAAPRPARTRVASATA